MEIIKTNIEGPIIIKPKVFVDSRGYFFEGINFKDFSSPFVLPNY